MVKKLLTDESPITLPKNVVVKAIVTMICATLLISTGLSLFITRVAVKPVKEKADATALVVVELSRDQQRTLRNQCIRTKTLAPIIRSFFVQSPEFTPSVKSFYDNSIPEECPKVTLPKEIP